MCWGVNRGVVLVAPKLWMVAMKHVSIENAAHYTWGEGCDGWHLVRSESLSVIRERVPPGRGEVRHLHTFAEQFFYVLSGEASLEADGCLYTLQPGEGLHLPAGVAHQLTNRAGVDLHFLVTSTPPSHGDRVALAPCKS